MTKKANEKVVVEVIAQELTEQQKREVSFRDRALKVQPSVCGRCRRDFSGRRSKELAVRHRDGNPDNNPPDGSNWELLCLTCQESDRRKLVNRFAVDAAPIPKPTLAHSAFAGLADLMKNKK